MVPHSSANVLNNPQQLGKYQVQGILGEGGMGVVYRGYDPQLARAVAIKTIRRTLLKGKAGQELKRRFSREAQAEGSLIHPNIVAVYEYQEDTEGMPFFVMEYVEGKTLKEFLSRGMHFNLEMSLHIMEQLLGALAYSHKRGVVHRDIKPANILLLEDDSIKIADFGIAKMEESEYTKTGQVMGTPQYFSPEQALGQKTDGRSDLYSTALVFYELMAGIKPFAGKSVKEINGLEDWHLEKLDITDSETLVLFKTVMNRALAKDPNDRFQNAEEFSAALQKLVLKAQRSTTATDDDTVILNKRRLWLWLGGGLGACALAAAFVLIEPQTITGNTPAKAIDSVDTPPPGVNSTPVNRGTAAMTSRDKTHRWLRLGRTHLMVGRLISPQGSNAYHSYQKALEIDPSNTEALAGIEEIQRKLAIQSLRLINNGSLVDARNRLLLASELFPDNGEFKSLLARVERTARVD